MKTGTKYTDVPCDLSVAERPRYFPSQLITSEDLTLEQDYFRSKMRMHNRTFHGWGVVCGAEVIAATKAGSNEFEPYKIVVGRGYILDPGGEEVYIDHDRIVDVRTEGMTGVTGDSCVEAIDPWCSEVLEPPESGKLYVAVKYKQVPMRPVRVQPMGCGCDDTRCENSRWRDGYEIGILRYKPECYQNPPNIAELFTKPRPTPDCPQCPDDPWVVLAELSVDGDGKVTIDNCSCRRLVVSTMDLWWTCKSEDTTKAECTMLDQYGDLRTFDDEKSHLDEFSNKLQKDPLAQAFVIAFGAKTGEGTIRGNRAKDYLVNTRGVDAGRISVIEGGARAVRTQLWSCPPNIGPPAVSAKGASSAMESGEPAPSAGSAADSAPAAPGAQAKPAPSAKAAPGDVAEKADVAPRAQARRAARKPRTE